MDLNSVTNYSHYLGLGKTLFTSSLCHIYQKDDDLLKEIYSTERIIRKKSCGAWPEAILKKLISKFHNTNFIISENRDVITPNQREQDLNKILPFYEHIKKQGLSQFSYQFNKNIKFIPHHLAHAYTALAMSPFEKSIILVLDGAGSNFDDFPDSHIEHIQFPPDQKQHPAHEEFSVYLQNKGELTCVDKKWQYFEQSLNDPTEQYTDGLGIFYETIANYIFNSKKASGKVMGLAPFGKAHLVECRRDYLNHLDLEKSFKSKSKKEWENSENIEYYQDLAATAQENYESTILKIVTMIKEKYPKYCNLIFTGGSALNCTSNMKIYDKGIFKNVYIPPFPGDEGISFGLANYCLLETNKESWRPTKHSQQNSFFGPIESIPNEKNTLEIFSDFKITKPDSIVKYTSNLLEQGHVIGWYQGRSETGPRALGNRSILSRIDINNRKEYLNKNIKFRESFRPYGGSCLHEKIHEYFEVPEGFESPFMSFSLKVKPEYRKKLENITHIDDTSRTQTVNEQQNPLFYSLIKEYGKRTGVFCLINTSLNVMGDPIVESTTDAKKFLEKTNVYGIVIGNLFIKK